MRIMESFTRSPSLVLDLRDDYAEIFLTPGVIRRPLSSVRAFLKPDVPGRSWPFAAEAELTMVTSPAGFAAFFSEARQLDRTPASGADTPTAIGPALRLSLDPGDYELRVLCPAYQEVVRKLTMPANRVVEVRLQPGVDYPFPEGRRNGRNSATILRGVVMAPDGTPRKGGSVTAKDAANETYAGSIGATGQWLLVLEPAPDPQKPDKTVVSPVQLRFSPTGSASVDVPSFAVAPGTEMGFPLTAIFGSVAGEDGAPVAGADVTVDVLPAAGVNRSRGDGSYAVYFPLDAQRTGNTNVKVTATTAGGRTGSTQLNPMSFGVMNRAVPIIVK